MHGYLRTRRRTEQSIALLRVLEIVHSCLPGIVSKQTEVLLASPGNGKRRLLSASAILDAASLASDYYESYR